MTTPNDTRNGRRSAAARPIMIATAAFGGLVLLGVGGTAALAAVEDARYASGPISSGTGVTDLGGVTGVDLEIGGADVTLRFDDVEEATLDATGWANDRWTMRRDGDELQVESPRRFFDLCFGWCSRNATAVITLPNELEGIDLDLSLGAGTVTADGDFREVGIEVGAGDVTVTGAARDLDVDVSAGDVEIELADVRTASFEVAAGDIDARLTGSAPDEVDIDVAAGTIGLQLPDVPYRFSSSVAAGDVENGLRTDASAKNRVSVEVAAGDVVLRAGERPAR